MAWLGWADTVKDASPDEVETSGRDAVVIPYWGRGKTHSKLKFL